MHIVLIALHLFIVIASAVHVIRRGHDIFWIFIILMFSVLGVLIYFIAVVLPEMQQSNTVRNSKRRVRKALNPDIDLHETQRQHDLNQSIDNKISLAKQWLEKGEIDQAIELYEQSLTGMYEHDPHLLLGLSQALFQKGDYQATVATLDRIMTHNPDYRSQEGHLLYARAKQALGQLDEAAHEYDALERYYSGYEAKCRYAMLLEQMGDTQGAKQRYNEIVNLAKDASVHTRGLNANWIKISQERRH